MKPLRILIACEYSGRVREAFKAKGHYAMSCDLLPTEIPGEHYQGDVFDIINNGWDLMIAFPPCTFLTVTGNRWFNIEKYGQKAIDRYQSRKEAIEFFMRFAKSNCKKVAIENPVGIMSSQYRKPDQIIQPWQFGDAFEKKTCLWLKGLPELKATNIVKPPARVKYKSGKIMPKWYADLWHLPKDERAKLRSKTFQGIAKCMADQWGSL